MKIWRDKSGAAMAEAALVIPVMIVMLAGVSGFAQVIEFRHSLEEPVRQSARYLARIPEHQGVNLDMQNNLIRFGRYTLDPNQLAGLPDRFAQAEEVQILVFRDGLTVRVETIVDYPLPFFLPMIGLPTSLQFRVWHETPYAPA